MAGTKFQYDESGTTFYYFVLTFLAMVLIPSTYFFWPREKDENERRSGGKTRRSQCHCEPCIIKENYMMMRYPSKTIRKRLTKIVFIVAWIGLSIFAYKVSQIQPDYVTFDPFEILGIQPGASNAEVKKAYRRLSLIYHPDKETGDEKKFMRITKAHAALTDEQAKKNWEEYGNPDGPGAMSFGIALPSWIVEKENSMFVLLVYILMLMIVLPVCVRVWWSNSSKYGDFKVLLDTSHLYYYFINKTPQMIMRKVLMVICASWEFDQSHNSEIVKRPSDNVEIPKLMKQVPNMAMNNRERPLCFEYSLKARSLLYVHLLRLPLPSPVLEQDKKYLLTKLPYLIQEFVQCASQLTMLALMNRIARCPRLETLENAMKLNALVVQAMWTNKNALLQLPNITEDQLRHFINRRRNIRNMQQLASIPDAERRAILARLTDEQYADLLNVLGQFPLLDVDVRSEVIDDEDTATITAGALVTVFVKLTRRNMSALFDKDSLTSNHSSNHVSVTNDSLNFEDNEEDEDGGDQEALGLNKSTKPNKPWEKQKTSRGKKGSGAKKQKPKKKAAQSNQVRNRQQQQQQQQQSKNLTDNNKQEEENSKDLKKDASDSEGETSDNQQLQQNQQSNVDSDSDDQQATNKSSKFSDSDNDSNNHSSPLSNNKKQVKSTHQDDDNDDDWSIVKQTLPKKEIFKQVSKLSHTVHCPYFPEDKQEHWWIYIVDKKKQTLKTNPYFMTNLVDQEEIELKFMAPNETGTFQYVVNVRCDSYVEMDYFKILKLDVKEAPKEIVSHPQWEMSEEEDEAQFDDDSAASDSDLVASDAETDDDSGPHNHIDHDDDESELDD